MSTKISGADGSSAAPVGASRSAPRPQEQDSAHASSQASASTPAHDVQITGTARQLANLEQTVRDLPAVNETRVAQVRSAIEQGTYVVRPQHIADQLMQVEHALKQLPEPVDSES